MWVLWMAPQVRPHMNALTDPATSSSGDHAAQHHPSAMDRPADMAVTSKLAFVVWASQPQVATNAVRSPALLHRAQSDRRGCVYSVN
jgi:hypothetical protein